MMKHPMLNLPVLLAAGLCLAATAVIAAVVFNPPEPPSRLLPEPLPAPSFSVVGSDGQPLNQDDLRGRVWVCDFFLTRCTGVCPLLGQVMSELAWELEQDPALRDVQLISFSVDPVHDRPEILAGYRASYLPTWAAVAGRDQFEARRAAMQQRWRHVTAAQPDQAAFWAKVEADFKLMVGEADPADTSTPISHSDRLVLIDKQGRIRGYYAGLNPEESGEPLLADIRRLVRE
ncbi:MAG: SCO family protein [Planctomycetota bacterium]